MAFEVAVIIANNFVIMVGIERLMRMYFGNRGSSFPVMVMSYLFCWAFMVVSGLLLHASEAALVVFLAVLAIISLNYKALWLQKIAVIISIFALLLTMNFGVFVLLYHYAPIDLSRYEVNIAHLAINSMAVLSLSLLLQRFKHLKKEATFSFSPKFYVISMAVPVASVVLLFLMVSYLDMPAFIELLTFFILFAINVFDIYLYDSIVGAHEKNLKAKLYVQEKEYYLAQCRLMQESAGRVRSSRHDMKSHMATLKNFITENKADSAIDYIDNFLGDIGENSLHSETGNLALDSIINYKLKDIKKSDINLNLRLKIPSVLEIADADIVTIVSNLLDNALEAAAKTDEKTVKLNVTLDNGVLLIKAENSFNGELKEDMASLKGGPDHGHGLKNINRSVDKYGGRMKIAHTDTVFSVSILLYGSNGGGDG